MLPIQKRYASLLGSQTLQRFRKINSDLFNFRCPYCGDSKKNDRKARGYLFLSPEKDGLIFKCHNCGESGSIQRMLKDHNDALYKQYLADVLRHRDGYERDLQNSKKAQKRPESTKSLKTEEYLIQKGADRVSDLPDDHEAVQYLRSRCIDRSEWEHLYYTKEFRKFIHRMQPDKFERITKDTPAIIFPLIASDHKTLNGAQFRNLDLTDDFRYITIKVREDSRHFGWHRKNTDFEPTYVLEGAIDSLMLPPGALAVSGSDLSSAYYENSIYIFDNEPRNKEIVKKIEKVIAMGLKVCLLPGEYYKMDLNDIVCRGLCSKEELPKLIESHSSCGLRAHMKFSQWRKI